ncbi:MAG: hypothetical protein H8E28_16400 [Anaerolineae bacterium]|nr:hypothetical protein [Anaerolineae bacterium]
MNETKMTVRVPRPLLESAKDYASQHNTTLTRLVSNYLRHLTLEDHSLADAPAVRRLSGALSTEVAKADYQAYLEGKYGATNADSD